MLSPGLPIIGTGSLLLDLTLNPSPIGEGSVLAWDRGVITFTRASDFRDSSLLLDLTLNPSPIGEGSVLAWDLGVFAFTRSPDNRDRLSPIRPHPQSLSNWRGKRTLMGFEGVCLGCVLCLVEGNFRFGEFDLPCHKLKLVAKKAGK